jgi:hypothetical protein
MKTKQCNKCLLTLDITNFYDKQGKCKKCLKETRQCKHKKQKRQCTKCNGNAFCKHKIIKYQCRKCNGNSFCKHKIIKYNCEECDGSNLCEHKKVKAQCKKCKGSAFCKHGNRKCNCIECDGSQICEHKKLKRHCIKCNKSAFCEHKIEKRQCKKCGGKRICQHGKFKPQCKQCGGSQVCPHNKLKHNCHVCGGKGLCIHCKFIKGKKRHVESLNKKILCCIRCFYRFYPNDKIPRRFKCKQHYFNEKLIEEFGVNFFQYDKKIKCGCSGRMPDWFIDCFKYSIIIELDEDQHKYNSCDEKRMMELFQDLGNRNLVLIRINPDKYKQGEEKIKGCFRFNRKNMIICNNNEFDTRFNLLIQKIKYYMDNQPTKELTIERLFFDF